MEEGRKEGRKGEMNILRKKGRKNYMNKGREGRKKGIGG